MTRRRNRRLVVLAVVSLLMLASWQTWGRSPWLFEAPKPRPDRANVRYGPHERNVLDLWKAKPSGAGLEPTPIVVFFHGGAFRTGSKSHIPPRLIEACLDAGISVASANYRLSSDAPFPAPMLDGARAIQFLRKNARALGIDGTRIAASGSSAGAGIALWVGFHDDLADPNSPDPVARQSSRVVALGVDNAQCSYDPRFIKELIGGRAHEHTALRPFYGLKSVADADSPAAHALYEQAAPINYVSPDDPPAILFYFEPPGDLPPDAKPGQGIHHPRFGEALRARLEPLKIECVLHHRSEYPRKQDPSAAMSREMAEFFLRQFRLPSNIALGAR